MIDHEEAAALDRSLVFHDSLAILDAYNIDPF